MSTKEARDRAFKNFAARHPERLAEMRRAASTRFYQAHPERVRATYKAWQKKLKEEVLAHYGNRCACCGEAGMVFLTIDHVDGGGNQHRKTLRPGGGKASSVDVYRWIKKHGFPKNFQVLCRNCNTAKFICGVCPHEAERRREEFSLVKSTLAGIAC